MSLELSYYNLAATICSKIYDEIKGKILIEFKENNVKIMDIKPLLEYGNKRILEETSLVFKKSKKTKGIACPVSITTNNTVLYYTYDYSKENPLNFIKETDVVKINLGIVINDCIANLCETFTIIENKKINKIIKRLDKMVDQIEETIKPGEINDEIRILIESKCTEKGIFPIENCISFQHEPKYDESKYLILNYKKRYDFDDNLIGLQNLCFEYEKDEVYTIQLSVVQIDENSDEPIIYKKLDNSHLYRFNDTHYSLKLKSSREFLNECKSKHKTYLFDIQEYDKIVKNKFGINECLKNCILEQFPITVVTQNGVPLPVITKIFTLLVTEDGCKVLKYN